jgi:threonine dehydrogenase-like Zn-dependent dehydrogenase
MSRLTNRSISEAAQPIASAQTGRSSSSSPNRHTLPELPATMAAAVITRPGAVEMRQVPVPVPGPHQLLVKVEGCGVCASNIPPWEGRPWFHYPLEPGQLGHEGWGRVVRVGDGTYDVNVGSRVGFISNHSYAEYDAVDASSVVILPPSVDDQPFPAEPLGCAHNIFARSQIEVDDTVAIVGIGFLGALLIQMASTIGARVIAIARRPFALALAKRMGAAETVLMNDHTTTVEQVKELTDGALCEVVVEATGKQWPLDLSAELTAERGRLIIAGYHQDGPRQVNMQLWNWRGLDVINAHERDPKVYLNGMRHAVNAIEMGLLDPRPLYTHQFPLAELGEALQLAVQRPDGFVKALIVNQ